MPFELTIMQAVFVWFGAGILGAGILMFEAWFSGRTITAGDLLVAFLAMLFGIILLILALLALFLGFCSDGDPVIIRGKKDVKD